jgi:aminomuconate-semialdehyde/2-hydroxymuconate-6-semialdehyde dehydrogenase
MEVLNLIQGELISAKGGEWLDLTDPSKGKVYGRLPRSGPEDVNLAVESADKAFKSWSNTPRN